MTSLSLIKIISKLRGSSDSRTPLAALTAIFASGNLISTVLTMAGGLLMARAIEPDVLGIFSSIGLVLGYIPFLQLGILNGLNRELPYYIGQGKKNEAHKLAAAAQFWAILVGGGVTVVLWVIAGWQVFQGNWQLAAGWTTYGVGAFVLFYGINYLQITYRTGGDFARLAVINVIVSSLRLALVAAVVAFGFYGLCLRLLMINLIQLGLLWYWRPIHVSPSWSWERLRHLLKIGAPIFVVGQVYAWWSVLDLTLVLKCLGTKDLGLYQLAVIVGTTMSVIPNAVSQIVYPRMAETYGRTGKLVPLLHMMRWPILALTAISVVITVVGVLLLPPVVQFILPQYTDGIPAARWMLISAAILSLSPTFNIFNVAKRQDLYAVAIGLGIGAYAVALWWLISRNLSLSAFPQAMLAGRLVFIGLSYLFLVYLAKREKVRFES